MWGLLSCLNGGVEADNVGKITVKFHMYVRPGGRRILTRTSVLSCLSYPTVPILLSDRTPSRRNPSYRPRLVNLILGSNRRGRRTLHRPLRFPSPRVGRTGGVAMVGISARRPRLDGERMRRIPSQALDVEPR